MHEIVGSTGQDHSQEEARGHASYPRPEQHQGTADHRPGEGGAGGRTMAGSSHENPWRKGEPRHKIVLRARSDPRRPAADAPAVRPPKIRPGPQHDDLQ
eukprot:3596468-Alexandrium_andersonii.AAC.1